MTTSVRSLEPAIRARITAVVVLVTIVALAVTAIVIVPRIVGDRDRPEFLGGPSEFTSTVIPPGGGDVAVSGPTEIVIPVALTGSEITVWEVQTTGGGVPSLSVLIATAPDGRLEYYDSLSPGRSAYVPVPAGDQVTLQINGATTADPSGIVIAPVDVPVVTDAIASFSDDPTTVTYTGSAIMLVTGPTVAAHVAYDGSRFISVHTIEIAPLETLTVGYGVGDGVIPLEFPIESAPPYLLAVELSGQDESWTITWEAGS